MNTAQKNARRMIAMLKYLPCTAGEIPLNLRNLLKAEREGLAYLEKEIAQEANYVWKLTPKGEAFVSGKLKAPKSARRLA